MAITITNGTSVGATGGANVSSISVDAPALTTSQLHIIAVTVNATGATITTPTGYTSLGTTTLASTSGTVSTTSALYVFYRRGTASAGSVTITSSGGAGRISAVPVTISGVDTTTPIQTSATAQSLTAPSITATGSSLLVTAYAVREGTTAGAFTITQASGMTERGEVVSSLSNGTTQCGTEVATLAVSAGATGTKVATTTANTGYIGGSMSILINEASGTTEPPPTEPPVTTGGFINYLKNKFGTALKHYYPLNDTYQAQDVVGTLDGTVSGTVSFTSTGAVFSGAANNYITIPDNNDFSVTTTGGLGILVCQSVSDWASTSNLRSDGFVHWMGKGDAGRHEWTFRYYPSSDASRPKRTSFYHYIPSGGLGTGSYIQDDDANNVERVFMAQLDITTTTDPTGGNGFGSAYPGGTFLSKNGVYRESDGFTSGGGGTNIEPVNTAAPVTIGCRNDKDSWQKGKIRRVAFFNRKLTAAEVTDIYNNMSLPEDGTAPSNVAPVARLTTTTPTVTSGATINLSAATSTDADGTISTYTFTPPSGITLSGTGSTRTATAPTVSNATTYTFSLVVTDNSGTQSPASTVTVTVNPAAVSGTQTALNLYSIASTNITALVNSSNLTERGIARGKHTAWLGDWMTESVAQSTISGYVTSAAGLPFVAALYAIPGRDSGGYSSGGFTSRAAYLSWITAVRNGSGSAPVWWILEPDAAGQSNAFADATVRAERLETIRQAVVILKQNANARVYIDASMWVNGDTMAGLLQTAGMSSADGFSCNVSNFEATATCNSWAATVITGLNNRGLTGKKYVVDTSRNGNGVLPANYTSPNIWSTTGQTWCNPPGRGIGLSARTDTSIPTLAGYLWVKNIGQSDGNFPTAAQQTVFTTNAPIAGSWWQQWWDDFVGHSAVANTAIAGAANVGPTAVLSSSSSTYTSGQTITLSGAGSTDSDGTIATYTFTAPSGITLSGSGSTRTATAPTVSNATNYTFGLTVTDNSGAVSSTSNLVISVQPVATPPATTWTIPYDTRTTGFLRTVNVSTKAQLDAALADLRYGDKVVLAAGTYTYTADLKVTTPAVGSYTRSNPPPPTWITGPANAVITRTSTSSGYALNPDKCNFVTFNGFSVKGGQKCMIADESNNNVFQYMDFGNSGMELFHLRNYSSYNKVLSCVIHHSDVDGGDGGTGEGLYVGQSESNWGASYSRTGGAADTSNYNEFYDCDVQFALSECVDIKEGTTGTIVRGCTFDMSKVSGENSADSAMDVKGNACIIEDNIANNPSAAVVDGFQTHILFAGYGNDNKFARNKATLNGSGYCVNVQLSGSRGTATGNIVYSNNVVTNGTAVSNIALTGAPASNNQQPIVALSTNSPGTGWQGGNTVTITATASDPDGSIASYSWATSGGTLVGAGATTTFKVPYDPATKTYTITASAVDNLGLSSTVKTITISAKSWPTWFFPNGVATPFKRGVVSAPPVSGAGFGNLAFGNSEFGGPTGGTPVSVSGFGQIPFGTGNYGSGS